MSSIDGNKINNNKETLLENFKTLGNHASKGAWGFHVVKHYVPGSDQPQYVIKTNSYARELFTLLFGHSQKHFQKLRNVILSDVQSLKLLDSSKFVKDNKEFTELFWSVQKYNQALATPIEPEENTIFSQLDLQQEEGLALSQDPTVNKQLMPFTYGKVTTQCFLDNASYEKHKPHTIEESGLFHHHQLYHYSKEDVHASHGAEAKRIFFSTQIERIISWVGKQIEGIAGLVHQKVEYFKQFHYFRDHEDEHPEQIYQKDAPLANLEHPTSYWVGHATCFLRVPLKTETGEQVAVNLITDPVEGDINAILYPRMTDPARKLEDTPVPHIFMLSHNHRDHYDHDTIVKLLDAQPIMLVPEGDGDKFRKLGFKNVYENNWWQTVTIPIEQAGKKVELKITTTPANHWSGQGICDGHHAAFVGYVVHGDSEVGDIYFAGDTARLTEEHIGVLRDRFDIRKMFQPGGPDEEREDMKTTHQASVDGLWMHFNLLIKKLYRSRIWTSKAEFIEEAKKLQTIYMHTKTFKLGNLHFDDTESSLQRVYGALDAKQHKPELGEMKSYEADVLRELREMADKDLRINGEALTSEEIGEILRAGVHVPKIGERTALPST